MNKNEELVRCVKIDDHEYWYCDGHMQTLTISQIKNHSERPIPAKIEYLTATKIGGLCNNECFDCRVEKEMREDAAYYHIGFGE